MLHYLFIIINCQCQLWMGVQRERQKKTRRERDKEFTLRASSSYLSTSVLTLIKDDLAHSLFSFSFSLFLSINSLHSLQLCSWESHSAHFCMLIALITIWNSSSQSIAAYSEARSEFISQHLELYKKQALSSRLLQQKIWEGWQKASVNCSLHWCDQSAHQSDWEIMKRVHHLLQLLYEDFC